MFLLKLVFVTVAAVIIKTIFVTISAFVVIGSFFTLDVAIKAFFVTATFVAAV